MKDVCDECEREVCTIPPASQMVCMVVYAKTHNSKELLTCSCKNPKTKENIIKGM